MAVSVIESRGNDLVGSVDDFEASSIGGRGDKVTWLFTKAVYSSDSVVLHHHSTVSDDGKGLRSIVPSDDRAASEDDSRSDGDFGQGLPEKPLGEVVSQLYNYNDSRLRGKDAETFAQAVAMDKGRTVGAWRL